VKIYVTQDDINKGERQQCHLCPIARAVADALGVHSRLVEVTSYGIRAGGAHYKLPLDARDFMYAFDEGLTVEPFEFELVPA
jgi:hypothetical protein